MFKSKAILAAGIAALCGLTASVDAADPSAAITRLTPPSALFTFKDPGAPYIARFLPGQRFDLQCTVQPVAGVTVTSVAFKVDNATVTGTTNLVTTGLLNVAANSAVATRYAYSITKPGVHTLTAIATLSDNSVVEATGNFEIVRVPGIGTLKNVIVMIGDGMGAAHRTAARIVAKGVQQGKANAPLNMDTFPYTGMVETSSLNSIITDSSPGAACYSTGNKSNNNQQGVFPDDTADAFDNPRVETIGEFLARKKGKSLGIVTTADVFDATPGAFGSHTSNRGAGTGICDQYLDEMATSANLKVLMGGGRKWFLKKSVSGSARTNATDYQLPAAQAAAWGVNQGAVLEERDLIADFESAGFTYAADKTELVAKTPAADKLLGLFAYSNMNVALDKIGKRRGTSTVVDDYLLPDQPMLDEMTSSALDVLKKNSNGFVLMVEGASIDKQAHNMDTERWILETLEFDRAIGVAKTFAQQNKNTLVIITADHECSGAGLIGASMVSNTVLQGRAALGGGTAQLRTGVVGTYDNAGFPVYDIQTDGYPLTTDIDKKLLVGYAANADRYEDWLTNARPLRDSQQPFNNAAPLNTYPGLPIDRDVAGGFMITGQVSDTTAVHTASDIPLSAFGRGAQNFSGYFDNTEVFFKVMSLFGTR